MLHSKSAILSLYISSATDLGIFHQHIFSWNPHMIETNKTIVD